MHSSLLLLLLGLLQGVQAIPGPLDQQDVFHAIPTQIEQPPADDDDDDAVVDQDDEDVVPLPPDGFDVDYVVNRPTSAPEEEDDDECDGDDADIKEEGEVECIRRSKDLTPYKKYMSYSTWNRRPLFVIIIGGLRWDYFMDIKEEDSKLKAFDWIRKHGTTLSQVVPVFPPYDLPTWTSLATGLYPKTTGVIGDYMFNLKTRQLFSRGSPDNSLDQWWMEGEPIWSVAAKHGRKVCVLNWHDCTLPGKNIENPEDCRPYRDTGKTKSKQALVRLFNKAVTKIHKDGYDLSIVYTDNLKKVAKQFGPNSQEVVDELAKLDEVLQGRLNDIKNKKERADLKLNILLLGDYGLNGVNRTTKVVLDDFVNFNHVQYVIQRGGSTVLVPFALKAGDIMGGVGDKLGVSNMVGINAYVRDVNLEVPMLNYPEIPEHLNYGGLTWTHDILLVAKPGFQIQINTDNPKLLPPLSSDLGESGYDPQPPPPYIVPGRDKHKSKELRAQEKHEVALYNEFAHSMKTVGFAWGPDFKSGYTSEPIEIVDIYQVMAFLLKIPPNLHDGEWNRIRGMLTLSVAPGQAVSLLLPLAAALLHRIIA